MVVISIVIGIINQLITGGAPPCGCWGHHKNPCRALGVAATPITQGRQGRPKGHRMPWPQELLWESHGKIIWWVIMFKLWLLKPGIYTIIWNNLELLIVGYDWLVKPWLINHQGSSGKEWKSTSIKTRWPLTTVNWPTLLCLCLADADG